MFVYKFEKGQIRTGIKMNLTEEAEDFYKECFGDFIYWYDDKRHTKEELEVVHAFIKVLEENDLEDDDNYELILTKDKNRILEMKVSDEYILADMDYVLAMCEGSIPINFYCLDGLCSLVEEEYIQKDGNTNKHSNYVEHI